MKRARLIVAPVVALVATGCLATKGDIRLLQDELRASRAQVARSDSAHRVTSDSLAMAISALAIAQGRGDESLMQGQLKFVARTDSNFRALTARQNNFEITTREQFKAQADLIAEVSELARQNSKTLTTRPPVDPAKPPVAPTGVDSTALPPPPVGPDPVTLLISGRSAAYTGGCGTARRSFNDILTQFPNSPQAPEALYLIAVSYTDCESGRNPVAADSVYQLVTLRYPKHDHAADALYKRAEMAKAAGKTDDAQKLYQRVVCEYTKSAVFTQANDKLTTKGRCKAG